MPSLIRWVLTVCVAYGSAGCATLDRTTRATPAFPGHGVTVTGDTATLANDSILARVYARYEAVRFGSVGPLLPLLPFSFGGSPTPPPMRVEIQIAPQKGRVSFDPYAVRLRLTDGQVIAPSAAARTTPTAQNWYRTSQSICHYSNADARARLEYEVRVPIPRDQPVVLTESTCFVLLFPLDAAPHFNFDVLLDGLTSDGRSIQWPAVEFRPVTSWRWRSWTGQLQ